MKSREDYKHENEMFKNKQEEVKNSENSEDDINTQNIVSI